MSATPTTAETAITDWVASVTGMVSVWANQNNSPPGYPYVLLNKISNVGIGFPETTKRVIPDADPGQEIESKKEGVRHLTLSVQVFSSNADMVGENSAEAIAGTLRDSLELDSVRAALRDGGLTYFMAGGLQNLSTLNKVSFEGRWQFDAHFYAVSSAVEIFPKLRRVAGWVDLDDHSITIPFDTAELE